MTFGWATLILAGAVIMAASIVAKAIEVTGRTAQQSADRHAEEAQKILRDIRGALRSLSNQLSTGGAGFLEDWLEEIEGREPKPRQPWHGKPLGEALMMYMASKHNGPEEGAEPTPA